MGKGAGKKAWEYAAVGAGRRVQGCRVARVLCVIQVTMNTELRTQNTEPRTLNVNILKLIYTYR